MNDRCPDCERRPEMPRREFIKTASAAGLAAASAASWPLLAAADSAKAGGTNPAAPESLVKQLYDSMSEKQRKSVCFAWDYQHPKLGLLRTRVANNWHIVPQTIGSDFYTKDQQEMIRAIFEGLYSPEWVAKIDKQLKDDAGGYGKQQNIAIFGKPGEDKFELVMTGRHLTTRCDGNSSEHVAFGGPIFYGHAAQGFNEKADHPGNVFWPQALEANKVWEMLDGKQRKSALVPRTPAESAVGFKGSDAQLPGIPVAELTADQKAQVQKVLAKLIEPYRKVDQQEVKECLEKQGGLDKCSLSFYQQGDIGEDGVWDNWRLEGPSFVWYFRGAPHVHVWVNVASDASVKLNA